MKIITVSRQFGSGGRELGRRMAEKLGFDYFDREIITMIAKSKNMDENYIEKALDGRVWQGVPLHMGTSLSVDPLAQIHTGLLLEQRRILEGIGKSGRDCVIVGRNADVILSDYKPFKLFVCADKEARIDRCAAHEKGAGMSRKELEKQIKKVDRSREELREVITGRSGGWSVDYSLTVNTSGWNIKELSDVMADYAMRWFERSGN